jgi:hypothetical protein
MVKRIDNSGVVRGMRRSYALMVGALLLGWGALASAQTVTASYQPFPVTGQGQTSSQDITLTFNNDTFLLGVTVPPTYPNFYVANNQCPLGGIPAGTQCTVTVIFQIVSLPGWGSAQAPIGRSAPLQVQILRLFSLAANT